MNPHRHDIGISSPCPLTFRKTEGKGRRPFYVRGTLACRWSVVFLLTGMLLWALSTAAMAAAPFTNNARWSFNGSETIDAAVMVMRITPTPSDVSLMQYAPAYSGAQMVAVPQTAYSDDGSLSGAGVPIGSVFMPGNPSALDLSGDIPLVESRVYHQGEPVFIRIADGDKNADPAMAESIWVQATADITGDVELLLLTETGPDTGVYMGYIQTSGLSSPSAGNGSLEVVTGDTIRITYTDSVDFSDTASGFGLVDPMGVVFNSHSAEPVDGVTLTLIDVDSGMPALVLGDDGLSEFPATIISGGAVTDASGKVYAFAPGGFRFPFVHAGNYRIAITPPAGYAAPSAVSTADLAALPGGPFVIAEPGSRGEVFVLNPGPVVRMDIPVDPVTTGLWVRKSVNRDTAAVGDFLQYTVNLEKIAGSIDAQVTLTDRLPVGFRYQSGSARVNGIRVGDPQVSGDGRTLSFDLGLLSGEAAVEVRYVAQVGAGAPLGRAVNTARAFGSGGLISNTATADILVKEDLFRSKNIIVGRVIINNCTGQASDENDGLTGARIYLEGGTTTITDERGRYHFEGVSSGTHVVQLDLDGLAEKFDVSSCEENARFAGTPFSQFVDLQGGTLWRADFHLNLKPKARGRVQLQMDSSLDDHQNATYRLDIQADQVPLRDLRLTVELPPGGLLVTQSATLDGHHLDAAAAADRLLTFALGDRPNAFAQQITFKAQLPLEGPADEMGTRAWLTFNTPDQTDQRTPIVTTSIQRSTHTVHQRVPNVVLRANFDVLQTDLNEVQKADLENGLGLEDGAEVVHVIVKGYTDNLPISEKSRHIYLDNYQLSRERAEGVVSHLSQRLGLRRDQITVIGMGPDEPVGDNTTDQGRADNRRVHVDLIREQQLVENGLSMAQPTGMVQAETRGLRPGEIWPQDNKADRSGGSSGPEPQADGILSPADKALLMAPIAAVRIQLDSRLKPKLTVDDREVAAEKIGFKLSDPETGKTLYTYIGVDFGAPGEHSLKLSGIGPFGNARFEQVHTIWRTGEIAAIRQVPLEGNVADGRTPVRIALDLRDDQGRAVHAPVELGLTSATLKAPVSDQERMLAQVGASQIKVDANGVVEFQAVTQSGMHRAVLAYGERQVEVETYVQPELRDWILVGLAEGGLGYNTVSGNMENLSAAEVEDALYSNGRLAFFAKGKVKGSWLITAAYDSEGERKDDDRRLFQSIDPDAYYTLYGDAAAQEHEAASIRRIYVKIEREQFYALFGDFNTDMTVTELSRYSRSFNGIKSEYNGDRLGFTVFAADTNQAFVKDEIQGDGTSGLYRLSRSHIVINSEKVIVETRNRFHSETVVSSQNLTRYVDYTIDYDAGTLFFKSPVYSRDEALNPIFIVVDYETESPGDTAYNFGGRGAVKLLGDRLEAGATYIHQGPSGAEAHLSGMDARLELGHGVEAKAEIAATSREEVGQHFNGQAYLAELNKTAETYDAKIYYRQQDDGFGLGQQNGSEDQMRKIGIDGTWRFRENWTLDGELRRSEQLASDATQMMGDARVEYRQEHYSLSAGLRTVEDRFSDGTIKRSDQLIAGASRAILERRMKLRLSHEQSVGGNNASADYPTRTLAGVDFQLTRSAVVFAEQELTFGEAQDSQSSRLGLKATPWSGGQVASSLGRNIGADGDRLYTNLGLAQTIRLDQHWTLDGGLDHSRSISHGNTTPVNTNYPSAGGVSDDFTAISLGAGYDETLWSWVGRVENRWGEDRNKWGLISGIAGQVRPELGLSAGLEVFQEDIANGSDSLSGEIKLSAAWRPDRGSWIILDRLAYVFDRQSDSGGDSDSRRLVNNFNANYKPQGNLQVALQYGAKYVLDTFDNQSFAGFTDLKGVEARYDINRRWDVGFQLGMLHAWNAGQIDYRTGVSLGYAAFKNAWLSLGYNFWGFQDQDFSVADFTAQGPYVKFRFKMDQQSVKELVSWFKRGQN